ncbi:MAG: hypothetical protein HY820_24090 [Acidobacteria bacterium]|nr:hypothetical protein [Acidobacteriota bacterium]
MSSQRVLLLFLFALSCYALDFRNAVIVTGENPPARAKKTATMIAEEIEKRTQLRLKVVTQAAATRAAIVLAKGSGVAEGFSVATSAQGGRAVATVTGNDDRGLVFGAGYLLRQFRMERQKLELDEMSVRTAPKTQVRGHQLGYRPKTNSYDAWSVPMWDQYIRELAIFGNNTIELIPPRSDDDDDSPHFPLPKIEMREEMSRIADEYAVDVSIWYPAMDKDYSDPKTVEFALKEWEEVYRRLPRIDVIFVPGGDPGHTQPKYLMALLEKQTQLLHKYHPKAQMWMSPQSFSKEWMEEFFGIMQGEPKWLSGIVFGPQNMYPLPYMRNRIPKRYPIRFYPDITHSLHAQFPAQSWDWAYASTEGREGINPRPLGEAVIFRTYNKYTNGFVTYSEGCNDDVNKFVWSGLGWDPDANVKGILLEYSRFFFGHHLADPMAQGLLALERNWIGPLTGNGGVETTLGQFREMERTATPQLRLNWRFQQALYRAYYDAFLRARLLVETAQEQQAMGELVQAQMRGSLSAMEAAERVLDADMLPANVRELRQRVFELAEALFQSIRMQLSVSKYRAIAIRRGANLDGVDYSLNNRFWLKGRFAGIRAASNETDRLKMLDEIVNWTNPGPGGFYDDLGNMLAQPHLVIGDGFEKDPDFLRSALMGFGSRTPQDGWRTSWYNHAETMYDGKVRMRYTDLDPKARYRLRVVYAGDQPGIPIKLVANGSQQIHDYIRKPAPIAPVEFDVPAEATRGGTLELEWTRPPGLGGAGRGAQVSEVWLVRNKM